MVLHQAVFERAAAGRRLARASTPRGHVLRGVAFAALLSLPVWLICGVLLFLFG